MNKKIDTGKIEERSIKTLEDIIDKHDTMESRIKKGDKYMSWDGSIVIYKPGSQIRSKVSMDYEIPVQIKGHIDSSRKYLNKRHISYTVGLEDLQLYCDNYGCLYFQIFISESARQRVIFYASLYPSKAKSYLDKAKKKKNKSSINVVFSRLEKNEKELYFILKQFSNEVIRQGSGRGQLVPKMIKINELNNVKEITATAVGTKDEFGLLKRLATGDVCIYGSLKDGDIKYPIEWNDGGTFYIRKTIYQTISVDDMEYYASYDVQMSSNDEWVIFPSKNLEINLSSGSIKFTPVTGLYLVRKDADFLLSLEKGKSFVFNRDARIEYEATALSQEFHRKLQTYIALDDIFHNLGIKWDTPLNKISTDTRNALQKILNYKKGVYNERLSEKYTLFDCKLDGKSYPIVIGRRDNDRENDLFNAAYSRDLHAIDADSGGNYYRVPLINLLDDDMFAHLYLYDYEQLIEQIDYSQLNQHTVAAILHAALKLIKVYDRVRDKKLLDIANYAIDKLKTIDSGKPCVSE